MYTLAGLVLGGGGVVGACTAVVPKDTFKRNVKSSYILL